MVLSVFGCFGDRQRQRGTSSEQNDGARPSQDGETEVLRDFSRRSGTSAGETKPLPDHGSAAVPVTSRPANGRMETQGLDDYGNRYPRPALTPSGQDPKVTQDSAELSANAKAAMSSIELSGIRQQVSYAASALSSLPPAEDWQCASSSTDCSPIRSLPSSTMPSLIPGTFTDVGQLVYVGQGAQGLVYRGTMMSSISSADTGTDSISTTNFRPITVAVKFMICNTRQQLWHRAKEGLLSKLVSHPNLVSTLSMDVTLVTPNTQQEWLDKWVEVQRHLCMDPKSFSTCTGSASTFTRTTFSRSRSRSAADGAPGPADACLQVLVPPERPCPDTKPSPSMISGHPPAMEGHVPPPQGGDRPLKATNMPYWMAVGGDVSLKGGGGGGGGSGPRPSTPPPIAASGWPSHITAAAASSLAVAPPLHRHPHPPSGATAWTPQVPSEQPQRGATQDGRPPIMGMPYNEWNPAGRSASASAHPTGLHSPFGSTCSSINTSASTVTGAGPQPTHSHPGLAAASTVGLSCFVVSGHGNMAQIAYGEDGGGGGEGYAAPGSSRPGASGSGGSGSLSAPTVYRGGGGPAAQAGARSEPVPFQDILYHLQAIPGRFVAKVIMEFCDGGTLLQCINAGEFIPHPSKGSRAMLAAMRALLWCLQEIAAGMAHLHSLNIIHGDLKPSNVLLTSAASSPMGYECKVSDFGLATALEASEQTITYENWGTVVYMAPETCAGRCRKASDVYSFGVVMWQMVTGQRPYAGLQAGQVLLGVKTGTLSLQWPSWVHKSLVKVGQACLRFDPKERPGFKGIRSALAKVAARLEQKQAAAEVAEVPDAALMGLNLGSGSGGGETGGGARAYVGGGGGGSATHGFCCEIEEAD